MSNCNCGCSPCVCVKVISKLGEKSTTPGPPGPPNSTFVETGVFTLAASGLACTGGVLGGSAGTPTITITTSKKIKFIEFNVINTGSPGIGSFGKDNLTKQDCIYFNDAPGTAANQAASLLVASNAGNGFNGKVTTINATTFVITFNKIGTGLDLTGQWHAITG